MRITHVSDYYLPRLGGIELQVRDLSQRQAAEGHVVEVVTATRPPAGTGADDASGAVRVRRLGAARLLGGIYSPLAVHRVAAAVRASKADVVHAHVSTLTPTTWWAIRAAVRQGLPVVVTVHSMLQDTAPLMRLLERLFRWRSWPVTYTAVSDVAADGVRTLLSPGVRVGVLPNGVAPEWWTPAAARPTAAADGDPGELVVLAVMRLSRRKRGRQLVEAVRRAAQVDGASPIRLVIAGDGPQRRPLERQVRRAGLTGRVELVGRVTRARVAELLAAADVFAAPALLESFGIAALEARMAGVPVVARAQSGISDFVDDERHGLLVEDDDAFAAALARLAVDDGLRAALASTSRAEPPPLGWDVTLAAVGRAYEEAVSAPGRGTTDAPAQAGARRW